MKRVLPVLLFLASTLPAMALVGGARSGDAASRHVVMIVSTRGAVCTGTALARDLVLTAAHCVGPGASYKIAGYGASYVISPRTIVLHPQFDRRAYDRARVTADVALVKLENPLPPAVALATLDNMARPVVPADSLVIAGIGVTAPGTDTGIGIARTARLVVTGDPGSLQIRLVDPATRNARAGLGACTGDSGGPALRANGDHLVVIGVVSWSTGPNNSSGCGGLTGVTPLARYRGWIVETARKMGSEVP